MPPTLASLPSRTARAFRLLLDLPAVRALREAAGAVEVHLVGGVLRDRALGLPVKDVDAIVSGRGVEIAERLAAALPARLVLLGGKEFAAYRLVGADGLVLDLWDRAGAPLWDDLARRDFTVNSFALEASRADLVDPFGGLADLELRLLRATTAESFAGDPLRVLRLPRLMLKLPGFAAEPETLALAKSSAAGLAGIAAERVREELEAIFEHPEAHRGLALLEALDVYPGLWLGRPGEPGRVAGVLGELEALPGRILDLRELEPAAARAVDARAARLAATFAHLPSAPPAPLEPGERLERFRDAGYLTRPDASAVASLLRWQEIPGDGAGRCRFLHQAGGLWPTAVCSVGARATGGGPGELERWRRDLRALVELVREDGESILQPARLLTGREVQEVLGVPPGPEVGRVLDAVRWAQVEGRVRTKEAAVELVRGLGRG